MDLRRRLHEVLEEARPGDRGSRRCDLFLIALITVNLAATVLESVPTLRAAGGRWFALVEGFSVAVFTLEYLGRLWTAVEASDPSRRHPLWGRLRYSVTPIAIVDLLAILPFYLAAFVPIDLRFLRVLRILRIFKLSHYFSALEILLEVVRVERHAFGAAFFLLAVGVLFASSGIYLFEHAVQPEAFGSIPAAMWWAVVTLTTVGYGDVTPLTVAGKLFGTVVTVMGIGMVALPTGILASGFSQEVARRREVYGARLREAWADGVLDADEHADLDRLRRDLGLAEEDVEGLSTAEPGEARQRPLEKCPHCGEGLVPDPQIAPPRPREG